MFISVIYIYALFITIHSFLYGYALTCLGPYLVEGNPGAIFGDINIKSTVLQSASSGITLLFATFSSIAYPFPVQRWGCRKVLIVTSCIWVLGGALATIPSAASFIISRAILGLGVGVASGVPLILILEMAPTDIKGRLMFFHQINVNFGQCVMDVVAIGLADVKHGWWYVNVLGVIILGIAAFASGFIIPESPLWLLRHGKRAEAAKNLERVRNIGMYVNMDKQDQVERLAERLSIPLGQIIVESMQQNNYDDNDQEDSTAPPAIEYIPTQKNQSAIELSLSKPRQEENCVALTADNNLQDDQEDKDDDDVAPCSPTASHPSITKSVGTISVTATSEAFTEKEEYQQAWPLKRNPALKKKLTAILYKAAFEDELRQMEALSRSSESAAADAAAAAAAALDAGENISDVETGDSKAVVEISTSQIVSSSKIVEGNVAPGAYDNDNVEQPSPATAEGQTETEVATGEENAPPQKKTASASWRELFTARRYRRQVLMASALMASGSITGINSVMAFASKLLGYAGLSKSASRIGTAGCGIAGLATAIVTGFIIDRFGRRILFNGAAAACGFILIVLGIDLLCLNHYLNVQGKLAIILLIAYIVAFNIGLGGIPWAILPEISASRTRTKIQGVFGAQSWLCNAIVVTATLPLINLFGQHDEKRGAACVFFLFAAFCVGALLFGIFFLIETSGLSEEIIQKKIGNTEDYQELWDRLDNEAENGPSGDEDDDENAEHSSKNEKSSEDDDEDDLPNQTDMENEEVS